MFGYDLDIMPVSESHWTGSGALTTTSRNYIVYSSRKDGEHMEGVAIMITNKAKKSLIEKKRPDLRR